MDNLKGLDEKQLIQLSEDIRKKIIETVSKNGGHLSSNLGIVELTLAIHKVFNTPDDKLIFDVSHQSYAHKIITGRDEEFDTLRKFNGLSGYTNPKESEFDTFSAGHSSTAVSLAIGTAIANKDLENKPNIIAVVGDASATNGLTLEALNFLGANKDIKVIIIINDNDMSVSKNVGALAKTFNKIRVKRDKSFVYKITPKCIHSFLDKIKNGLKSIVYKKSIFDAFNLKYFSGIDGHNFKELERYLNYAKNYSGSVVLHVKTIKGKGYSYAENDKVGLWHNVGPFDIETGEELFKHNVPQVGSFIADELSKINEEKHVLKVICAAMALGNGINSFKETNPDDFIDVGIAEENAVTIAGGISAFNKVPFVFIYSTFLQRAYDQLLHDVARTNQHVVFCLDRSGIVDGDGDTHQGIFDLSFLIPLPNVQIMAPSSNQMAVEMIKKAYNMSGPVVIRYPKYLPNSQDEIDISKWNIVLPLSDVNVITYGVDVLPLKRILTGKNVGLIDAHTIKPLDEKCLNLLKNNKKIIVYEQVNQMSSLGTLIQGYYKDENVVVSSMAIKDSYLTTGKVDELKALSNISYSDLLEEINK